MDIINFQQLEGESLYEAWNHFKLMLCKFLYHGLHDWLQSQTFYKGLDGNLRSSLDGVSVWAFISKTYVEGCQLMKSYMWPNEQFTCRAKLPTVNTVGGKDKFQQILV